MAAVQKEAAIVLLWKSNPDWVARAEKGKIMPVEDDIPHTRRENTTLC